MFQLILLLSMQTATEQIRLFILDNYSPASRSINMSAEFQHPIGPQGAALFAQLIHWPVSLINLSMYFIKDDGMQAIIQHAHQWPDLLELRVEKNEISCHGLKSISLCDWSKIEKVNLNKNNIQVEGFKQIVGCNWPNLKNLEISHCLIGPEGAAYFKQANWPQLELLRLNYSLIGNEGMRSLSSCEFPHLRTLQISNNKLDGKAMHYLSLMDLPSLKTLNLNKNQIGRENGRLSEVGSILLSRLRVSQLTNFHIFGNDITLSGIREIFESGILGPNCFIEVIRNCFSFQDIKEDIQKHNIFCNYFSE